MDSKLKRAVDFLEHDPLRNIVLLKTIFYYPHAIQCHFHESASGRGVLLLLSEGGSYFDCLNYPGTDCVVLATATEPAILTELLRYVSPAQKLLFKLLDPQHHELVHTLFDIERVNAYISYTTPSGVLFSAARDVVMSAVLDNACLDLYAAMGHARDELKNYFARGQARSFTVYENTHPVSSCFTFPNYQGIHEIAGVFTEAAHRRRGLARQVVETALHHLMEVGQLARYQVQEDNRASIRLAEVIGLRHVVTYEHWRHNPAMKATH
jgi:RimJ/RimL family protein N-acetyltransferase